MKAHPKEARARILLNRKITPDCYRLRLLCPEIARIAEPGQFVMLRVNELKDPFLRRPFGFSRIFPPQGKKTKTEDEGALEIFYKIVGRGTSLMTQLREGHRLDLLGPLGKGFSANPGKKRAILVGGGIGIAPLIPWAERLQRERRKKKRLSKNLDESPEVLVLIGGKSWEGILGTGEFKKMGMEPKMATEDGSMGVPGLATDLLERELMTQGHNSAALYACGPVPMLARVAQIADQFDLPCQVLLEARMACGVGACLGCAVKIKEGSFGGVPESAESSAAKEKILSGGECGCEEMGLEKENLIPRIADLPAFRYVRACQEGPVFEAREILWE
jgi:dihydroorotate dehydrogenase electron transfer subunit